MAFDGIEQSTLRKEYINYMLGMGKAKNTANTTAAQVFAIWNRRGEGFFWQTMKADDAELRVIIQDFVQTYYPKQTRYLSGYLTSVRYFRQFLDAQHTSEPRRGKQNGKQKPSALQKAITPVHRSSSPVLTLTGEMLEETHQKVLSDPSYGADYALLDSVLKRFPNNTDPEIVALKIALIDVTNSTHIGTHRQKVGIRELADIIVGIKDFDVRLRQGDPDLVPLIARTNGNVNFFSFASKYCTFHSVNAYGNDDYVILDRVVKHALPKYVSGLHEATIDKWVKTFDYAAYKGCIDALLDENGIFIPFRRRKLDHYLWYTYRKTT